VPWAPLAALLTLVAATVSCSKPSPGLLELQASQSAVRAARSWQSGTTVQKPSGGWSIVALEKVECPSRLDRTEVSYDPPSNIHEIWFDGMYYKQEVTGEWSAGDTHLPASCGHGPGLVWDGTLYDDLDAVAHGGEVRAGQPEPPQPNTTPCKWWDVAPGSGVAPHYSVCVDEADHLPSKVRSQEHSRTYVYTFTNWNATSVVLPKDIAVPGK
jgi:hypothetical protein